MRKNQKTSEEHGSNLGHLITSHIKLLFTTGDYIPIVVVMVLMSILYFATYNMATREGAVVQSPPVEHKKVEPVKMPVLKYVIVPLNYSKAVTSYLHPSLEGNLTSTGIVFTNDSNIVAHKELTPGTILLLKLGNKYAVGEVQDCGPFVDGRTLDASQGLAKQLGFVKQGVVTLEYTILYTPKRRK